MGKNLTRFPAEWEPQDAIILTWPHSGTDWAPLLNEAERNYLEIARAVIASEKLLVICPDIGIFKGYFTKSELKHIRFYEIPSNDTWTRDHGPISVFVNSIPTILDFHFNGWGNKFDSSLDNKIPAELFRRKAFNRKTLYTDHTGFVLEGGSIESDGQGTILTTSACLLNPNRNPGLSKTDIETRLSEYLGAERFLWLDHGAVPGDDTDSHIDTLARFCNPETITYVQCNNQADPAFDELKKMEEQLKGFVQSNGKPYQLVPLPMTSPVYDNSNKRLPTTYANFLITNQAVLLPTYNQPEDRQAAKIMSGLFPGRQIIGINCLSLVKQNGSLHCITMQVPQGFIK